MLTYYIYAPRVKMAVPLPDGPFGKTQGMLFGPDLNLSSGRMAVRRFALGDQYYSTLRVRAILLL